MNIKVKPFTVPNFIVENVGDRLAIEARGFPLHEFPANDLAIMCDDFRAGVFAKAGTCDPGLASVPPVPMVLHCPECRARHIDVGEFATKSHHTHACQECGMVWRPAVVPTVGVQFLPGFKNGATP